ncbi:MAG: glycosyl hydrolase [Paenibacillaceae bacterium]
MSTYNRLKEQFASVDPPRSLFPLLWLHGDERETEAVIRREIAAMDEGMCGGFVIESRPHNDYLGERWWQDIGYCLDEAANRSMDVWLFDEEYYPSGIAGGKVLAVNPDYRMQVLVKESFHWKADVDTANTNHHIAVDWTQILKIVCIPYKENNQLEPINRLAFYKQSDFEQWQINQMFIRSEQAWEVVYIGIRPSWSGRMYDLMVDYLCPEITDCFISVTYEATKEKVGHLFGSTIKGFFGDETSFENFGSYDVLFGMDTPCMPWSRVLLDSFKLEKGYDLLTSIESLWYEMDDSFETTRFDFMDVMTELFSTNFFGRIQAWCHANGLRFIGHVVEDNQAHMHHGYGPGHFFRTTRHFDFGGYDIVLRQVDSDLNRDPYSEHFPQFSNYRDQPNPDFFKFTLAKLAQSAAHLEIQTDLVMCENFGAYGWDLGMKEMKWLTDWQTARGTNWYVPHAFSPLFPDLDCPPHFYAGGNNPQWPFFHQWATYANRSCLMLRDADHVCSIAVLYPAESHWAGDDVQLDTVSKVLMEQQYDFNILSCDLLVDSTRSVIDQGQLIIGKEQFRTIILPGINTIPLQALERLEAFVRSGGQLIAIDHQPTKDCGGNHAAVISIAQKLGVLLEVTSISGLNDILSIGKHASVKLSQLNPDLRVCHYRKGELDIFFLNNESVYNKAMDLVSFQAEGAPELWYPMNGEQKPAVVYEQKDRYTILPIQLAPYEAVFVVFKPAERTENQLASYTLTEEQIYQIVLDQQGRFILLDCLNEADIPNHSWRITAISSPLSDAILENMEPLAGLGDWRQNASWDKFSGSVVYEADWETEITSDRSYTLDLGEVGEIATVSIDGTKLAPLLCPPYRVELPAELLLKHNVIAVEVTNTLGAYLREGGFNRDTPEPSGLIGPVTLACYTSRPLE